MKITRLKVVHTERGTQVHAYSESRRGTSFRVSGATASRDAGYQLAKGAEVPETLIARLLGVTPLDTYLAS
ncbi:MAG: hypothetical protein KAR39_13260 [Thermoplasmata archaeon]|nr:hypothetical protein [Thermoplasmata archaeon]